MKTNISELSSKSVLVFIGNIIGQFIGFISVIIFARLLGSEIYGFYVYMVSFLSFFVILPNLGMNKGLISFLSRSTLTIEEKKSILTFSLLVSSFISIFVIVVSIIFREVIATHLLSDSAYISLFLIMLPSIILTSINGLLLGALRAIRKIKEIIIMSNIVRHFIMIIVTVIFVLLNQRNYLAIVVGFYLSTLLTSTYYFIKLKKYNLIGKLKSKYDNKKILFFSIPLLFSGIVSIIMQNIDKYMIGYLVGVSEVAIYKIALQFGTVSIIALNSVNTIFAPMISTLYHDDKIHDLKNLYSLTTKWITIINLMIFGMIVVFSKDIMNIAGKEFIYGGAALIIISLGQIINSSVGSVANINVMTGKPRYDLISGLISMAINIILNYLLIPNYGINGAAFATAVSLGIKNIINFILMYKRLKIHPYDKSFVRLFGVSIISIISIYMFSRPLLDMNYFLRLIICGIVYSTIFITLVYKFVMSDYEIRVLKREVTKRLKKSKENQ